ncbi:Glycosyltransferase-like protein LARGE2 [Galdieria sulphuraria]|nr:Glycosyltransferase-like protein LARGE2 [Galdieria sulphuraria]
MISSLVMSSSPNVKFHFHLISDKKGLNAAKNWYTLWNSACAVWNIYDIESSKLSKALDQFHSLTGGKMRTAVHYHGKEALWKLLLPSFLQSDNLLVLDTDMIILRDVLELWHRWRLTRQSVHLGMPCMSRDNSWLYPLWREIFPENGTLHCMSGTLLMRPRKMRQENWINVVASSTNKILEDFPGWTAISADQDIFNLVAKSIPEKVTNIGCEWNCYYTWFAKFLSANEMPISCSHRRCAILHYNNRSYTNWWHNRTSFFQRFWDAYENFPVSYLNAKGYSHCFF